MYLPTQIPENVSATIPSESPPPDNRPGNKSDRASDQKETLSTPAKIGIAVNSTIAGMLLLILAFVFVHRRRRRSQPQGPSMENSPYSPRILVDSVYGGLGKAEM